MGLEDFASEIVDYPTLNAEEAKQEAKQKLVFVRKEIAKIELFIEEVTARSEGAPEVMGARDNILDSFAAQINDLQAQEEDLEEEINQYTKTAESFRHG
jgi:hypothetical protein